MKIRMLTTMASPDGTRNAGQEYDLPEAVAKPLVQYGAAILLDEPEVNLKRPTKPKRRTATAPKAETATKD